MLSLIEVVTYNPGALVFLVAGIVLLICALIVGIKGNDYVFLALFGILGFSMAIVSGIYIAGSAMTTETITPCDISLVMDGGSVYYVSDVQSDVIYKTTSDVKMRMHLNQSSKADIIRGFYDPYPYIVKSYGKLCDPSILKC